MGHLGVVGQRGILDGVCKALSRIHIQLMISEPWTLCAQPLPSPPSCRAPQYSGRDEKAVDLFSSLTHGPHLAHMLSLSPVRTFAGWVGGCLLALN